MFQLFLVLISQTIYFPSTNCFAGRSEEAALHQEQHEMEVNTLKKTHETRYSAL
jgi:hypothetical protein